jgi:hypothetical protein
LGLERRRYARGQLVRRRALTRRRARGCACVCNCRPSTVTFSDLQGAKIAKMRRGVLACLIASAAAGPCDIYAAAGTPCVGAYSLLRALFTSYSAPLYYVRRASDNTTRAVPVAPSGFANTSVQEAFCAGTSCAVWRIVDQSLYNNDLTVAPPGGSARHVDNGVNGAFKRTQRCTRLLHRNCDPNTLTCNPTRAHDPNQQRPRCPSSCPTARALTARTLSRAPTRVIASTSQTASLVATKPRRSQW